MCKGRTIAQIEGNITKYDKSSGTVLAGLVRRRKAELDLFKKTVITQEAKEDETLELTNYQWTTLRTQVKKLLDAGTINDTTWLNKLEKKTLTISELAWLTFTVSKK